MKLKEKYNLLKTEKYDYLILIKSGTFYITFDNDALIMNNLFSYQILNSKVGFPISNLDKIISKLHNESINYIISNDNEEEIIELKNDINLYNKNLELAKKKEFKNSLNNMLLERIKFLIENNEDNYDKIRRFIDEL